MKYIPITCKSAIHTIKNPRLPYALDVNIYRGCEHKCHYCFAAYSHRYMNNEHYFDEIYIKENIASVLDQELSKRRKKDVINLGGICDSYQPIESKAEIMPSIWKVMIKHNNPIILSTKSTLIERDIDYIKELSKHTVVNIAFTITCMDDITRSKVEPNASPSSDRFKVLQRIKAETNAVVGVHVMPIIPYINDSMDNLESIYQLAHEIKADYVLPGTLYLRGITKKIFFDMIKIEYPHLYRPLWEMYAPYANRKEYKYQLYQIIHALEKKYQVHANYMSVINEKKRSFAFDQLTLF